MKSTAKKVTRPFSLCALAALVLMLLAACSTPGGAASSPAKTTPTPSPTPAVTMYTGDGFTLSYPQGWTKSAVPLAGSANQVVFQDALGNNAFTVVTVANVNLASPSTVLKTSLDGAVKGGNMTNASPANVPASVSLAGETWTQAGRSGTISKGGVSIQAELVAMVTNHRASASKTRIFEILYGGQLAGSKLLDDQIFQTMLASFKFTS